MHHSLAIIGSLIIAVAGIPYIIATLKGKTHPNIVTWFTWTILNVIVALAAFADGALQTALFAATGALTTCFITIASLRYGIKRYTKFDVICLLLALLGIILWRLTNEPAAAIAMNLIADFFGFLPTVRHGWKDPHRETWQTFTLSALGSGLVLASLTKYSFVSAAYPLWFFVTDITMTTIILSRRRKLPAPEEKLAV